MAATVAAAYAQEPFSDKFTKDTALNPGWTLEQPNPANYESLSRKGLLLDTSDLNGGSDLWCGSNNFNATVLLQPIASAANWTVQTTMNFSPQYLYSGAGLLLAQQTTGFTCASEFHRFNFGLDYFSATPVIDSQDNGTIDPNYVSYTGTKVTLKLQKAGSTYTYSYSADGKNFVEISTINDSAAYSYVGLVSLRTAANQGPDAQPTFLDFKIKLAK